MGRLKASRSSLVTSKALSCSPLDIIGARIRTRNAKPVGGNCKNCFQRSLRAPRDDPLSVAIFQGLNWLAIPHLGIYVRPFRSLVLFVNNLCRVTRMISTSRICSLRCRTLSMPCTE